MPSLGPCRGRPIAMKLLEHPFGPIGRHADAGVGDGDADFAAPAPGRRAARRRRRVNLNALASRLRSASSASVRSATTLALVAATRNSSPRSRAVALKPARSAANSSASDVGAKFGLIRPASILVMSSSVSIIARSERRESSMSPTELGRFALPQAPRQRADEQRHRLQRLAQVMARGGDETRLGAIGFDRFVARGLQLGFERALAGDVEQQQEATDHPAAGVGVGVGEAAHDVDHAAGEIDRRLEFGVRPRQRAFDGGARARREIPLDFAEAPVEIGGGRRRRSTLRPSR